MPLLLGRSEMGICSDCIGEEYQTDSDTGSECYDGKTPRVLRAKDAAIRKVRGARSQRQRRKPSKTQEQKLQTLL